ncbi:stage II sporulation protein D [Paenibacillus sp. R14(2021)]|uniref:stage II sporulation protein D n=1 Tax=Paenibacillus sp. R14(2021) TaxID=2859228 RepID=UPI002156FCAF|nr:stage II sporulation protein D [Paenibacillus sp. R14(2021)]
MEHVRWKAGRSYRRRWWTKGWWIGFLWGALLVMLVKGAVFYMDVKKPEQARQTPQGATVAESAPVEPGMQTPQTAPAAEEETGKPQADLPAASGITGRDKPLRAITAYDRLWVSVYLTGDKRIEKMPIELYVRGVLAGEMPVDFELEALKAQAIAARTYIYRRLLLDDRSGLTAAERGADVDDTVMNQVYIPLGSLLKRWSGSLKDSNLEKLNQAVEETRGQIITYEGEPIQASFFSTSNGYTENASDYWSIDLPYLHSVASPWDKTISPRYRDTVTMKVDEAAAKLGVKAGAIRNMRIMDTTAGKRIKSVKIGTEKLVSGREIREKLSLASSGFTWTIEGNEITFTTQGFGHGVGMSQWGANGMAQEGAAAQEILAHFYTGTRIQQASGVLN